MKPASAPFAYGNHKSLPQTSGGSGQPDTFFGPRNKVYADFVVRRNVRVRGVNFFYYVLDDQMRRIDGVKPLDNRERTRPEFVAGQPKPPAQTRTRHSGLALYGERVVIQDRLDSTRRQVEPDWPYLDPLLVRGIIPEQPEQEEDPDERGSIVVRRFRLHLPRRACEKEWLFQPRSGDVVFAPRFLDHYYDVEKVNRDESRWGNDGFFTHYILDCVRTSKYDPSRKLSERKRVDGKPLPDGHVNRTTRATT